MTMKTVSLLILLALFLSMSLSACNTLEGAGKDVQSAGRTIEDAAKDDEDEG